MDYLIVYLEILILTFVYTGIIFFSVRRELGSDIEVRIFKIFLSTLMTALVIDGFTQAQFLEFIHLPPAVVAFLYSLYMFLFSGVLPFLWFIFAELRLGGKLIANRKLLMLFTIPAVVMVFMSFASMKTGWFYELDDKGIYTRGRLWSMQIIFSYFYFLFTTVHAFMKARNEASMLQRRQYYVLSMFLIAPIIGGLFQLILGNHPFVAPATGIAMLFIFINVQGSLIHNDSLTGLYNRKSAERYIEELKLHTSSRNPFYLYMMDIDSFKSINDEYGHIEGDRALRIISNVLQRVTDKHLGFVCRLGGDEFLAVIEAVNIKNPDEYPNEVKSSLEKEEKVLNLPYSLIISSGYTKCDSPANRLSNLIAEADKMMYEEKENKR